MSQEKNTPESRISARIDQIRAFLRERPEDSFLLHALALERVKLGEDPEARKIWEDLLGRDPEYVGSYYHLGKLLERQSNYQEAAQVYRRGIDRAMKADERHTAGELQTALMILTEDYLDQD